MSVCFWGEELTELFKTRGNEEIFLLLRYITTKKNRSPDWQSETAWEIKLADYVRNINKE